MASNAKSKNSKKAAKSAKSKKELPTPEMYEKLFNQVCDLDKELYEIDSKFYIDKKEQLRKFDEIVKLTSPLFKEKVLADIFQEKQAQTRKDLVQIVEQSFEENPGGLATIKDLLAKQERFWAKLIRGSNKDLLDECALLKDQTKYIEEAIEEYTDDLKQVSNELNDLADTLNKVL